MPTNAPDDLPTVRGLSAGRRVFGRYVLESELGAGGMGVVWRARDTELDEPVALKFLPEVVARDDAAVAELKDETRHARKLTHLNIVRIYQFEREGSTAAVSMEFVDGMTLTKLRLAQPGTVFAVETLAPLVTQLCAALNHAHGQAKIVHRDLKPANILVTRDGVVKVTDFGIARSLSDTHTRLTGRVGNTSGTLVYMSPQQLLGEIPAASDDIYALGASLYELLTGKPVFQTGDVATQIRDVIPKSVNSRRATFGMIPVPAKWEETIQACLAKRPEDRPKSASEVSERLELGETTKHLKPHEKAMMTTRTDSHLPLVGILVGVLALIVALVIGGVGFAKISALDKIVPYDLQDRLTSVETDARNASAAADKASKGVDSLQRSAQAAFDSIGPEIGGLKDSVKKLEDAQKAREAARNRTQAPSGGSAWRSEYEYVVQAGDTGTGIAHKNGVSISEMEAANPGIDWKKLKVGQRIKIQPNAAAVVDPN